MGIHGGRCFARGQLPFSLHEHPSGIVRNRLCLVAGICVLILFQGLDAGAQANDLEVDQHWSWSDVKVGGGAAWRVRVVKEYTTHDSVWVESIIYDRGTDAKPLLIKEGALPRVVLSGSGMSAPKQRAVTLTSIGEIRYDRWPAFVEPFHSFRVDLRAVFGRLPAGDYQVWFAWPKDAYEFPGLQKPGSVDLRSAACKFCIRETTLDEAAQKMPPCPPGPTMVVPQHKDIDEFPKGLLVLAFTNRLELPVRFPVASQPRPACESPSVSEASLFVRKWAYDDLGWGWSGRSVSVDLPLLKDSIASESVTLRPGQSIELVAPHRWLSHGDGFYLYELRVLMPMDDQVPLDMIYPGSPKTGMYSMYSKPFQVKLLDDN